MKPICIIPARSGSKRIKNKNLINFFGKPIIAYSIEAAIKSRMFSRVIVTTDSKKISEVSKKLGAEVPFLRPKKISNDRTAIKEVICHCINRINSKNIKYHFVIYATNPLIKISNLKKAYEKILKSKSKMLIGIKKYDTHPLKALEIKKNRLIFKFKKELLKNSQNYSDYYYDDGSFFIFETKSYLKRKYFFSNRTTFFIHSENESLDLNTKNDLKKLRTMYKLNNTPHN